jgi:hypothetical protein
MPIPRQRPGPLNGMTLLCTSIFYRFSEGVALGQQLSACGQWALREAGRACQPTQTLDLAGHDEGLCKHYAQQYYSCPQANMR